MGQYAADSQGLSWGDRLMRAGAALNPNVPMPNLQNRALLQEHALEQADFQGLSPLLGQIYKDPQTGLEALINYQPKTPKGFLAKSTMLKEAYDLNQQGISQRALKEVGAPVEAPTGKTLYQRTPVTTQEEPLPVNKDFARARTQDDLWKSLGVYGPNATDPLLAKPQGYVPPLPQVGRADVREEPEIGLRPPTPQEKFERITNDPRIPLEYRRQALQEYKVFGEKANEQARATLASAAEQFQLQAQALRDKGDESRASQIDIIAENLLKHSTSQYVTNESARNALTLARSQERIALTGMGEKAAIAGKDLKELFGQDVANVLMAKPYNKRNISEVSPDDLAKALGDIETKKLRLMKEGAGARAWERVPPELYLRQQLRDEAPVKDTKNWFTPDGRPFPGAELTSSGEMRDLQAQGKVIHLNPSQAKIREDVIPGLQALKQIQETISPVLVSQKAGPGEIYKNKLALEARRFKGDPSVVSLEQIGAHALSVTRALSSTGNRGNLRQWQSIQNAMQSFSDSRESFDEKIRLLYNLIMSRVRGDNIPIPDDSRIPEFESNITREEALKERARRRGQPAGVP